MAVGQGWCHRQASELLEDQRQQSYVLKERIYAVLFHRLQSLHDQVRACAANALR